jgi:putative nucleotidyltransferase with HDIG domain
VNIDPLIKEIAKFFSLHGKELYLVGGALRDMIRKKKIVDFDLATNALPDEVNNIIKKSTKVGHVIPTGIKHGTVTIRYKNRNFEVTTFRTESTYSDGRRPDKVEFGASIEEDLSRRDFTMNAIAWKLPKGPLIDPFGGVPDIKAGIIRSVGAASDRFNEDGLRPLRGVRFASQLGFKLDDEVLTAIPGSLRLTEKVSPERIKDELDKIINSTKPSTALLLMEQTGLLKLILPELSSCRNVEQKGRHLFDVLDHSLLACDYAAAEDYPHVVRMAALFHDIGKKITQKQDEDGIYTFYQHERESALLTKKLMSRLRYSNAAIIEVCHLISEHMFSYDDNWSSAAVRRFIVKTGEENIANLFKLRRADSYAINKTIPPPNLLLPFQERIEEILS